MKIPNILHIQRFSIHDGEGIRTTVFFKGCPLSCLWCHNPESQRYEKELLYQTELCTGCHQCASLCRQEAIRIGEKGGHPFLDRSRCTSCGSCTVGCMSEARRMAGKQYPLKELVKHLKRDTVFYENSHGGITLSGGEVMAQDMAYIEKLMEILHKEGYRMNIDTCGYAHYDNFKRVLPFTDTFLYDIKLIDSGKHKSFTGCDNGLILENVKRLSSDGAAITIRIPVIEGVNADREEMNTIALFLKENVKCQRIHILPYHETGKGKYAQLGRAYPDKELKVPEDNTIKEIVTVFEKHNIRNIQVGG